MPEARLLGEELITLQKEKGNICISIIVPTHSTSPDRRVDRLEVERAINKAKQLLEYKYGESRAKPLATSLDDLLEALDFAHQAQGLGLYVSLNVKFSVHFPFLVLERVMVEDNFELRDLLYKVNYSIPYFVLLLSENGVRLFEGSWDQLTEMKDKNFPAVYEDEFIYNPPSRGTSYAGQAHVKSFERDKSQMEEIRHEDFYRRIDEHLKIYIVQNTPLIAMAPKRDLASFEKVSGFHKQLISEIAGNYNHLNTKQLGDIAWPAMHTYMQNEWIKLVKEFEEKIGEHKGISGIQDVWRATMEGKAYKLLVEKDFRSPGFVDQNADQLYLRPPKGEHKILADAVDEIIEMVLEKNGQVYFTDNDSLKEYSRIALITRY